MRAKSALVLAPHYDDEVLGCGGLIARLTTSGAVVRVLFLSDSGGDEAEAEARAATSRRRREEAKAAAKVLGVAGIDHLGLPDGGLVQHIDDMAAGIRRAIASQRPSLLLAPSPLEASADHRAVFAAVHRPLGEARDGDAVWPLVQNLRVLTYEVNHPQRPDLLVDVSGQVETVERAMECYASQQEQHDYLGARLALSKFRTLTLPPEVRAAEAYRQLDFEDFQTRGPARLIAELGGTPELLAVEDGPTISVVVRTRGRPELLAEALCSLAESTYRRADVVVVNDGGEPPVIEDFPLPLEVVNLAENRGRAAAANAGVAAARGDFVAFLDDDDLVEPEHLATLAGLVRAEGVRVAYTDAAVGVYELDGESGWRCSERRVPYSRDFDPELLLFDNYIPFNTLVIERRLFEEVGNLDERLPFFEDWDFLIRLAALTPFHHLARVTCEYRHFRGAAHHILGDTSRRRSDFLEMKARVIAKHAERATADATARVVDQLRAESVAGSEEASRLRAELERGEESYHRLNGRLAGLEVHQQVLEESERRARDELREREGEVQKLSETLRQTWGEIERLGELIRSMESSRAWRAHQWWQRHKP
ncbi:MAG: glycosyltransferase [bacterium]|nr:glycosyltransferase [bacterium]